MGRRGEMHQQVSRINLSASQPRMKRSGREGEAILVHLRKSTMRIRVRDNGPI